MPPKWERTLSSVTKAKTRWGLVPTTTRCIFFRLHAPMAVIDYVIVHELSHTFYKITAKILGAGRTICPRLSKKRAYKGKQLLMEIF
ncbi:MAG: M48 family metallopeptidase [Christensenellaceae bacterium]